MYVNRTPIPYTTNRKVNEQGAASPTCPPARRRGQCIPSFWRHLYKLLLLLLLRTRSDLSRRCRVSHSFTLPFLHSLVGSDTMMAPLARLLCASLAVATSASATSTQLERRQNATGSVCPGYRASDVQKNANGMTAKLTLAGTGCNIYGNDIEDLTLTVEYQTGECFGMPSTRLD